MFLGLSRCPCLLNIHCTLHGNQLRRGQGEIWVLGKYTGPCCIHWFALILLSVSFYFCHLAFCLPVGSTYWAAGRLVGAMGRCNFVAGQSTPDRVKDIDFPHLIHSQLLSRTRWRTTCTLRQNPAESSMKRYKFLVQSTKALNGTTLWNNSDTANLWVH